jgi:glycosyltransferase involved in cell wall biosynthesis
MSMISERNRVEIVIPAHNEGDAIGAVLREFYRTVHDEQGHSICFLVCEDGSTDNTCDVVEEVAQRVPIRLLSFAERKGYSRAVIDGMLATTYEVVGFVDSDGQCDPADFDRLYRALDGNDMAVGYRCPRSDLWFRKLMSHAFGMVYRALFPVSLTDPSCPFLLIRRGALGTILCGQLGILRQGFWWEFNARAAAAGLRVAQVPVHHRDRVAGTTRVYRLMKIPSIAIEHLVGLFKLRRELASLRAAQAPSTGSDLTG